MILSATKCYATVTIMEAYSQLAVRGDEQTRHDTYVEKFLPEKLGGPIVPEVHTLLMLTKTYYAPKPVVHKYPAGVLVHVRDDSGREYMQRVDLT